MNVYKDLIKYVCNVKNKIVKIKDYYVIVATMLMV